MNLAWLPKWLEEANIGLQEPPGCETDFVAFPFGKEGCCRIGIVHEHRFAFYYWGTFRSENHLPPILISFDSHNDVGTPSDFNQEEILQLDIKSKRELSLYSWARLRHINVGQIAPALFLDFFSDVYVLLNKPEDSWEFRKPEIFRDFHNLVHKVSYFHDIHMLVESLPTGHPVFLDIDLDYFTEQNCHTAKGDSKILTDGFILQILSIENNHIRRILENTVGITFALEPTYCGGIQNCLHILNLINTIWFSGTLGTAHCKWAF